jgi:glycosyltransferase involved in cell wall biosynthesis
MLPGHIRIAFVLTTLDTGGAERQFALLAAGLAARGHHVEMVCLGLPSALSINLSASGVAVDVIGARTGRRVTDAWRLLRGLLRAMWRWRAAPPAVVHGVLLHGYVFAAFAGRLAGARAIVASRRSLGYFKAGKRLVLLVERLATRWTDVVVANSEAVRQDTLQREALPPGQVRVIHNGLEVRAPAADARGRIRQAFEVDDDTPVAIMVANLIHYKAHDVLLAAWRIVLDTMPTAVLWLVGDGPERARLETLAHELGIAGRVDFAGSRSDLPDLLAASDLLVHASREEGFCNAILEGMAAGLPVVATAVGGNPEAVDDGRTGWLVPPDDAGALAAAVARVLGDSAAGRLLGAAGQARVAQAFTVERMIAAYEALYAEVLAGKG